jgi:hypothetical protein
MSNSITFNLFTNYFFQSKYISTTLNYPKIISLSFNSVIFYKQKNKIFLFIKIIYLFFFNQTSTSSFSLKNSNINILKVKLRNYNSIVTFLSTFIFIHLPLIDSFSTEFKPFLQGQVYTFCFFKFPILFELNVLFSSLEYLLVFLNNYKFELQLFFKKQKNNSKNINLLHMLKLPLLLS